MEKIIPKMDNSNRSYMKGSYWIYIPCSYEEPHKWLCLFNETKICLQFTSEIICFLKILPEYTMIIFLYYIFALNLLNFNLFINNLKLNTYAYKWCITQYPKTYEYIKYVTLGNFLVKRLKLYSVKTLKIVMH